MASRPQPPRPKRTACAPFGEQQHPARAGLLNTLEDCRGGHTTRQLQNSTTDVHSHEEDSHAGKDCHGVPGFGVHEVTQGRCPGVKIKQGLASGELSPGPATHQPSRHLLATTLSFHLIANKDQRPANWR